MILLAIDYGCQLSCDYCYARGNSLSVQPDLERLRDVLKSCTDEAVFFHGLEPLVAPLSLLRSLRDLVKGLGKQIGIQSNGLGLEDPEAFEFVLSLDAIGISWDGFLPGGKLRHKTEEGSKRVLEIIRRLAREKEIGVIMVLNQFTRPQNLKDSLEALLEAGIKSIRLNPVHWPYPMMDNERLIALYEIAFPFTKEATIHPLALSAAKDCSFSGCSPLGTRIFEVMLDGTLVNCRKGEPTLWQGRSKFRVEYLQNLPVEEGGCGGCEFWDLCHGGCPATSDNLYGKSHYCQTWGWIWGQLTAAQK
jgi:radical SAM protein with 4Fe4S-binding SPASM domain